MSDQKMEKIRLKHEEDRIKSVMNRELKGAMLSYSQRQEFINRVVFGLALLGVVLGFVALLVAI